MLQNPNEMGIALFYVLCRYLHVVCTTLLVGGTLFYEMVVPVAIGELRSETQLLVFGRARWVFRWIVWLCAVLLLVTGVFITYQYWGPYTTLGSGDSPANRPGWWWAGHAVSGLFAMSISLMLTVGSRPPDRPLTWMRFNLVLLLVVVFLASATRHVRDTQTNPPIPFIPPTFSLPLPPDDGPSVGSGGLLSPGTGATYNGATYHGATYQPAPAQPAPTSQPVNGH